MKLDKEIDMGCHTWSYHELPSEAESYIRKFYKCHMQEWSPEYPAFMYLKYRFCSYKSKFIPKYDPYFYKGKYYESRCADRLGRVTDYPEDVIHNLDEAIEFNKRYNNDALDLDKVKEFFINNPESFLTFG